MGRMHMHVQMPHYAGGNLRQWLQVAAADEPPQRRIRAILPDSYRDYA